ncbi:O-antigen polymerase [Enterococcus gallinarum]|uniref:O-antigen polymerase n=1 Tax=Enterococcus TaxID=1350 RepID=UPI003F7672DC
MFIIFCCVMLIFIFWGKIKTGTYLNLITPFIIFWTLILFLSKNFSGNLFDVSNLTYNKVYLFIVTVILFYLLFSNRIKWDYDSKIAESENHLRKKNKTIEIFQVITQLLIVFLLMYYLFKYNNLKAFLPAYKLRIVRYQVGELFSSGVELLFYNYVITTVVELFGLLAIAKFIKNNKFDFTSFLSLLSLFLYSLIGLGRFGLFNALYFIVAGFWFLKSSETTKIMYKKSIFKKFSKIIVPVIFLLVGMVFIGINRFSSSSDNFKGFFSSLESSFSQAILYFIGPLRSLDYFFNISSNYLPQHYLGQAFFSGINEFFYFIFSYLGIYLTSTNSVISDLTSTSITIGNGVQFNAFYTAVFNAYLDGGVLGIIFFAALLGVIASLIWNFHIKRKNYYSYSLIVYFSLMLASTVYRFEFQQFKSFLIIGILIYLSQKAYKGELFNDRNDSSNCL